MAQLAVVAMISGERPGGWCFFRHAVHNDAADGGGDGGFDERFEGVLAGALGRVGVDLGEVVAGREDDGAGCRGAGAVEEHVALVEEHVEAAGDHGFEESELVGVVVVEGGAVDGGGVGDVLDGDLVDVLCLHEVTQRSLEELAGAADAWVANFAV